MPHPVSIPLRLLAVLAAAAAALALAACGEKEEPPLEDVPESGAPVSSTIVFERSGGVAGVAQRVEIGTANELRVSLAGEALHPADVDPAVVARARAAVQNIDFDAVEAPNAPPAADAFVVSITYDGNEVSGESGRLAADPQLRPAVQAFGTILGMATATNPPNAGGTASSPSG